MSSPIESLGLIAGNRSLPLLLARQARALGVKKLVAVGFEGETDPALAALVDEIVWLRVGQLSKLIAAFTDRHFRHDTRRDDQLVTKPGQKLNDFRLGQEDHR